VKCWFAVELSSTALCVRGILLPLLGSSPLELRKSFVGKMTIPYTHQDVEDAICAAAGDVAVRK
jgi:hypothetical protein